MVARSWKRTLATVGGGAACLFLFFEAAWLDYRNAAKQEEARATSALPAPGLRLRFDATAYCTGGTTAAGVAVQTGVLAADPVLLPVGSVVYVDRLGPRYNGVYTVMDTGPAVEGREVDVYMTDCREAREFGRRHAQLRVLRLGWNPLAMGPLADVLFQRGEHEAQQRVTSSAVK